MRQLRAGYTRRPRQFPQSVVLYGVRDVRDYRIHSAAEKSVITGGSAFNIKAESLRLGDFSCPETAILLRQHTEETGQFFTPDALLTQGQPWLVNYVADLGLIRRNPGSVLAIANPIYREVIQKAG